jgi:chromosome segregation ATPase
MKKKHFPCKWLLGPLLLLGYSPWVPAVELYRYVNDEGSTVIDYQVPPEHVKKGYEVLNDKGVVIRVVPRELTAEEQKEADARARLEAQAEAEQRRLQEWDESLMLRYSTIEDIEAAQERALMDLRIRVSILKSNKHSLKQQIENYQAQAAELERMGRPVDVQRLQAIEDLQSEIAATDRAIADRQVEIAGVNEAFESDIARFTVLLEMVEFRRTMMAQQRAEQQEKRHDPRR